MVFIILNHILNIFYLYYKKKQPKFISFHKTINLTKFKKIKDNY